MSSSPISLSSSEPPPALRAAPHPFGAMSDVVCMVDVFLGTGRITVRECLKLQQLSIIRLDQSAGSDLDVRIHGVSVAVGEAVVIDESMSVRVTAIVPPPGSGAQA
jgi:flagellar motor switch/type III secretory pathway protein FliN